MNLYLRKTTAGGKQRRPCQKQTQPPDVSYGKGRGLGGILFQHFLYHGVVGLGGNFRAEGCGGARPSVSMTTRARASRPFIGPSIISTP